MDSEKRACCAWAGVWALVGVVIALAWGFGNAAAGMSTIMAFAVPGLLALAIVGVVALATLAVPWLNHFSHYLSPQDGDEDAGGRSRVTHDLR